MKKLVILLGLAALLTSCTSKTEYGSCIGIADDKDPSKVYKVSAWNIGMGIVFSELIIPPIVVAVDEVMCPVGNK